jgi:glycosyltransferase involved in cell wall biosynthesis
MPSGPPRVTVLMTTFNGAPLIRESIDSILSQSFRGFELVVVDDASTDETPALLAGIADARLRVVRNPVNLGVVGARNRGLEEVRGTYVAAMDHDDLSLPDRLAAQVAHLDAHPRTVLVATGVLLSGGGRTRPSDHPAGITPELLRWMLHVDNPLTYSSVMFRADAVRGPGRFMREAYRYADDFDLYHRLLNLGDIVRLDPRLTIYRWHPDNTTHRMKDELDAHAARVLAEAYEPLLGPGRQRDAALVVRHLSDRQPPRDTATLDELGVILERLLAAYAASRRPSPSDLSAIETHAGRIWWQCVRGAMRSGRPWLLGRYRSRKALSARHRVALADIAGSVVAGGLRAGRSRTT